MFNNEGIHLTFVVYLSSTEKDLGKTNLILVGIIDVSIQYNFTNLFYIWI